MNSLEESLDERDKKEIPTKFILQLMELILKLSIFSFNSEYFQQEIGAAMGSRPIPHYANNFMARRIDKVIRELTTGTGNPLLLFLQCRSPVRADVQKYELLQTQTSTRACSGLNSQKRNFYKDATFVLITSTFKKYLNLGKLIKAEFRQITGPIQ